MTEVDEDFGSSSPKSEDTHRAPDGPVVAPKHSTGDWFYTRDEYIWQGSFKTREQAIAEGRIDYGDNADFKVACGGFSEPWPELFDHKERLLDFIDETHEDRKFEDSFTDEADLPPDAWEELRASVNAAWSTWTAKHRPYSRALELGGAEDIPAVVAPTTAPEAGAVGTTEGREPKNDTTREGADR